MGLDALCTWFAVRGQPRWRAVQVFRWMHARLAADFDSMTDLPRRLREELSESAHMQRFAPSAESRSRDGAVRYVFPLADGLNIETVLLPAGSRLTACLSSQAGCPLGCVFCMTGRVGFARNLTPGEIAGQLDALAGLSPGRITNVVFMGMGEPLLNTGAVLEAVDIITSPEGAGIGTRHVTVSTVGIPSEIARLSSAPGQVGLAVSLHSASPRTRLRMVPSSAKWPLPELRSAVSAYSRAKKRPVTLEICLVEGINDSPAEASALASFCAGLDCKINVIPCNPVEGLSCRRPGRERTRAYVDILERAGARVSLRRSLGSDAGGACGQLGSSLGEAGVRG